jgi:hypothetical protein
MGKIPEHTLASDSGKFNIVRLVVEAIPHE